MSAIASCRFLLRNNQQVAAQTFNLECAPRSQRGVPSAPWPLDYLKISALEAVLDCMFKWRDQ